MPLSVALVIIKTAHRLWVTSLCRRPSNTSAFILSMKLWLPPCPEGKGIKLSEWERESDRERQRENAYIPVAVSSISFQIARIILSLSLSLFLFFILFVAAALVGVQKRLKGKPRTEHKVGCYAHWVSNIPLSTRAHAKIFVQQQKTKTWKNPVSCHLCTFIFSSSPTSAPSCYLMCTFFCLIPLTLSLNTSFYFMSVVLFDCTAFGRLSHCSAVVDIVLH